MWQNVGFSVADQIVWRKKYTFLKKPAKRRHASVYLLSKGAAVKLQKTLPKISLYSNQKPVSAILPLIKKFSRIGDTILDPFVGWGTTAMAAKLAGRKYVGIELSEKCCQIARKRLSDLPSIPYILIVGSCLFWLALCIIAWLLITAL